MAVLFAVMLVAAAVVNLFAAFADEMSVRSFVASMTDFGLACGAGIAFILQAGALETQSRALGMGMQLLAFILEAFVIGLNAGATLFGAATEVDKRD